LKIIRKINRIYVLNKQFNFIKIKFIKKVFGQFLF
jgi:hypothetical protein